MSSTDAFFPAVDNAQGEQDLAPLAGVSAELRKSLAGAVKALTAFMRESELAPGADRAGLDTLPLRQAQQSLQQALGALEMVDQAAPALMVAAMAAAVLRFEQSPKLCTPQAVSSLESASFALLEYLQALLARRSVSPVALFPEYRDVQALAGNDKVHPADLWPAERRMREPQWQGSAPALPYGPQARALLDAAVLGIVKSGDVAAAAQMRAICLGFVAGQSEAGARTFWKIAAGFFDAFAHGLLGADIYVKRVVSRVLLHYAAMCKGDNRLPERLIQDLLFFCAQARPQGEDAPVLRAVRESFALERHLPVDYEQPRFGRFDPAMLEQARKRVDAKAEPEAVPAVQPLVEEDTEEKLRRLFPEEARAASSGLLQASDAEVLRDLPDAVQEMDFTAFEAVIQTSQQLPAEVAAPDSGAETQKAESTAEAAMKLVPVDEPIKLIDGLRIPLPLYNVYLNEADEWSHSMDLALQEWALEPQRPQPESAVSLAHSLARSSEAVGFKDLARLARMLEKALLHVRPQGRCDAQQLAVLQAAANEIRRLLHQFAAGFLKLPQPAVQAALQQLLASAIQSSPGEASAVVAPDAEDAIRAQQRGQLLDRLIDQAGEVLIARSRIDSRLVQARSSLYDLNDNLERLRQQLRDIEVQAETQMQSRLALSKDAAAGFDPLEFDRFTRVQELTRLMAESVNDVARVQRNLQRDLAAAEDDLVALGRQARDLLRDLQRTRMVE